MCVYLHMKFQVSRIILTNVIPPPPPQSDPLKSPPRLGLTKKMLQLLLNNDRRSCLQMFFKIGVLKDFADLSGKHLC